MFDPGLLADVAGVGEPVRLLGHRPVSADAGRRLERTIAFLQDNLLADPEAPGLPLMISTASRLLAAGVLSTFAHSASTARDGRHPRDRHPAPVRRAIAFMEDNAARPISGADIAAAHADLRTADPATTTVTAVAGRWGFLHAGRFAAAYKTAYGHPPSETLRS